MSQSKIRIRPVQFDPTTGRMTMQSLESSLRWYRASDIPKNTKEHFVILTPDSVECPAGMPVYLEGLSRPTIRATYPYP